MFSAASAPKISPKNILYIVESTALEIVSTNDNKTESLFEKSKCKSFQKIFPIPGALEINLNQSISNIQNSATVRILNLKSALHCL